VDKKSDDPKGKEDSKKEEENSTNYGWLVIGAAIIAIGVTVLFRSLPKK
jgi:hypothetical protein